MDIIVEPVGGQQDDFNGIINQSFQSEDSRDHDPDNEAEEEEEGEEEPEEDTEHTLQTVWDRARRREAARRKKNTKWAMCLYIMPAALVLLGLMIAIIVLQVIYFLEGSQLDKVKAELEAKPTLSFSSTRSPPPVFSTTLTTPTSPKPSGPAVTPICCLHSSTARPQTRAFDGAGPDNKPVDPNPGDPFPPYVPPNSGIGPLHNPSPGSPGPVGQRGEPGQRGPAGFPGPPGYTTRGERGPSEPSEPTSPSGNGAPNNQNPNTRTDGRRGPVVNSCPHCPGETETLPGAPPVNNGISSSTTTERPVAASIETAWTPFPNDPLGVVPGPGEGQPEPSPPKPPQRSPGPWGFPRPHGPPAPTQTVQNPLPGTTGTTRATQPTVKGSSLTTHGPKKPSTPLTQETTVASTDPAVDDSMVKRIEARQENLRSLLIWLILVLFGVGIVLIVGAYAIYKGWCCKYDLQAKTQNSSCLRMCCKMDEEYPSSNSRRNSPQEIIDMNELRRSGDGSRDIQSEAEITEDEREQSEDDSDGRNRSNRRRTRGPRTRRNQNRTTGEVTQIFIIPQGFEPPPTYEESVGIHSNNNEGQGQSNGNTPVVSRDGSHEGVNSSSLPSSAIGPHVTRLDTLPSYQDSLASSGIAISPEQLNQLTQGGSIPARARVFMLRHENRSQTVSSSRYHSRPGIPGQLVGREYVSTTRNTRTPPRRDRRSPHRNRRSPSANDEVNGDRSNRSTPRSTRSNRSNRSNDRDRDSPRRSNNRTPPSTTSRSRERPRNQRDNRSNRSSQSPHSRRSPSSSSRNSPSNTLQVFNRRDSDSSVDNENIVRPPRYTPHPSPGEVSRVPSGTTPRATPRNTPHPTPRPPRVGTNSDTTDSHESFTAQSDTNQVQIVANNNTVLLSSSNNGNHANVIRVANDNSVPLPSSPEPETTQSQTSSQPLSSAATPARSTQPATRNHQRGISSASEFSELSRFSSRESDTFSTDSLESVGCGVTIVHISPSAANMPPPANMTDMTTVPSHRRLPSSQSNSSGVSTHHDAVAMAANNVTETSESPRRLSRSSRATHTSVSSNPSLDGIPPIRNSSASSNAGNTSSTEPRAGAASVNVENTQDNTNTIRRSSPKGPAPSVPTQKPPQGEWVTHVPTPEGSPVASRGPEQSPSPPNSNKTVVLVEPERVHRREHSDAVSIGAQSIMTRQSERNSISGYSNYNYDAITLSSVVYVTSDAASLSDAASIGS